MLKEKCIWIVKPTCSSRGRGIYLITHPTQIQNHSQIIVSRYVENALLVSDLKFDLRIYVALTSVDPLIIYMYEDGLARFATVPYEINRKNLYNTFMHLTNYSINKKNSCFINNVDSSHQDYGSKWSLSALMKHLSLKNINTEEIMAQIEDIIIKALISGEAYMALSRKIHKLTKNNCFEIFGFDILIDQNLKAWLLEVNLSPSLSTDSPLDLKIKTSLITNLMNLVGINVHNSIQGRTRCRSASYVTNRKISVSSLTKNEPYQSGWSRIFPTETTWERYKNYFDQTTETNRLLYEFLYIAKNSIKIRTKLRPQSGLEYKIRKVSNLYSSNKTEKVSAENPNITIWAYEDAKNTCSMILKDKIKITPFQARMAFSTYLKRLRDRMKTDSLRRDEESLNRIRDETKSTMKFLASNFSKWGIPIDVSKANDSVKIYIVLSELDRFITIYDNETKAAPNFITTRYNNGSEIMDQQFIKSMKYLSDQELEDILLKYNQCDNSNGKILTETRIYGKIGNSPIGDSRSRMREKIHIRSRSSLYSRSHVGSPEDQEKLTLRNFIPGQPTYQTISGKDMSVLKEKYFFNFR